ncbi:MAG: flagellar biosynthesis protein FlhB [Anaerolinea sp.]|nr:flagellar biosynthesis protein FlhB [Anaerolinea sp.]
MADKTEAPTPRRLEEAREEGRVARSIELNSAVVLMLGPYLLMGPGKSLFEWVKTYLVSTISSLSTKEITGIALRDMLIQIAIGILPKIGLILVIILLTGAVITLAQTKLLWSSKRSKFDFKKVNPIEGFKRIFSGQGLIELAKALLKLGVIGWVAYSFLKGKVTELAWLGNVDLRSGIQSLTDLATALAVRVGTTYLFLAIADYAYQRYKFMKSMKMSKEEVKEDFKRSEGDPFMRGRIRSQQRAMARNRMMSNVPKATVVITNPTHIAIAIEYNGANMSAPKVLAKGANIMAQRIVDIARENNIPVVQNIPLAREIFKTVDVEQQIPPDLYIAVAEILAYIYRLKGHLPRPAKAQA